METGVVEVSSRPHPIEDLASCARREGITLSWSSLLDRSARRNELGVRCSSIKTTALSGTVWPQMSCRPLTIQLALDNPVALGTILCAARDPRPRPRVVAKPATVTSDWRDRFRANIDATWSAHPAAGDGPRRWCLRSAARLVRSPTYRFGIIGCRSAMPSSISRSNTGSTRRFDIPVANLDEGDIAKLLQDPRTIIGLSDAGAHANQQCDASFASYLLGHWCRDVGAISARASRVASHRASPPRSTAYPIAASSRLVRSPIWWRSIRRLFPPCHWRPCTTYPVGQPAWSREAPASIRCGSRANRRARTTIDLDATPGRLLREPERLTSAADRAERLVACHHHAVHQSPLVVVGIAQCCVERLSQNATECCRHV